MFISQQEGHIKVQQIICFNLISKSVKRILFSFQWPPTSFQATEFKNWTLFFNSIFSSIVSLKIITTATTCLYKNKTHDIA